MGSYLAFRDGGKTSQAGLARHIAKTLTAGFLSATDLKAAQRASGANMSVDLAVGDVFIDAGLGYHWHAWTDAVTNVAINTADPSNPRKTIVVAYVDEAVVSSAANENPGAFKFKAVDGTPAASPADPLDATIQTAVGGTNEWRKIARVNVGAGAGNIVTANIDDLRSLSTLNGPFASIAAPIANMKMVLAQSAPPGYNGLAAGAAGNETIAFPGLTTIHAVNVIIQKGTGGANMDRITWAIDQQLPYAGGSVTFRVFNNGASAAYISNVTYVAFGT